MSTAAAASKFTDQDVFGPSTQDVAEDSFIAERRKSNNIKYNVSVVLTKTKNLESQLKKPDPADTKRTKQTNKTGKAKKTAAPKSRKKAENVSPRKKATPKKTVLLKKGQVKQKVSSSSKTKTKKNTAIATKRSKGAIDAINVHHFFLKRSADGKFLKRGKKISKKAIDAKRTEVIQTILRQRKRDMRRAKKLADAANKSLLAVAKGKAKLPNKIGEKKKLQTVVTKNGALTLNGNVLNNKKKEPPNGKKPEKTKKQAANTESATKKSRKAATVLPVNGPPRKKIRLDARNSDK